MAVTLDEVSDGRLVLGIGAGWHEPEYHAFGYPYDHRVGRFEEALQIIAPLLREVRVDFEGRYYQARDCEIAPRGPRTAGPPILIGAQRPRMMRLAARFADIYDTDFHLEAGAVAERLQALESACAEIGRDSATLSRAAATTVVLSPDGGAAGYARFEQDGMVREVHRGDVEELIDFARTFEAVGVDLLTLTLIDPPGPGGIEMLMRVVEGLR